MGAVLGVSLAGKLSVDRRPPHTCLASPVTPQLDFTLQPGLPTSPCSLQPGVLHTASPLLEANCSLSTSWPPFFLPVSAEMLLPPGSPPDSLGYGPSGCHAPRLLSGRAGCTTWHRLPSPSSVLRPGKEWLVWWDRVSVSGTRQLDGLIRSPLSVSTPFPQDVT